MTPSILQRRPACITTWVNSVADQLTLVGPYFAGVPTTSDGFVKSGIEVGLSGEGSDIPAWRMRTGQALSVNLTKATPKGPLLVNTGNRPYYAFTVTYDVVNGVITLSRGRS